MTIIAAAVVTSLAIILLFQRPPIQFERELTAAWQMNIAGEIEPSEQRAKVAVAAIGTNGIPMLLDWIQADPARASVPKRIAQDAIKRGPTTRIPVLSPWAFENYKRDRAEASVWAFQILGSKAQTAIPALERIASTNAQPASRRAKTAIMAIRFSK